MMELNTGINLGSALVERNLITKEQLAQCIKETQIKGGYLSQHLIKNGFVTDTDITTCLTCQFGFCYLPIKAYSISNAALKIIPEQLIREFCLLPIEKNERLLTIVMADPLNQGVIETLRQITKCVIIVFISSRSEIMEAIEKYTGKKVIDHNLDKYESEIQLRDDIVQKNISNGLYIGANRRRYRRMYKELQGEFFLYPNIYKTIVKNISMSGILLQTPTLLPIKTQMMINIRTNRDRYICGVIEVIRAETKKVFDQNQKTGQELFEAGACFNFLTQQNHEALAKLLTDSLS